MPLQTPQNNGKTTGKLTPIQEFEDQIVPPSLRDIIAIARQDLCIRTAEVAKSRHKQLKANDGKWW